jgi:1-acyl-sn-glycerol-3-phosphate acyltransferase
MSEPVRTSALSAGYRERRVLLVGGTGFLGSVTLSLLLQQLPELERLYLVLRRRPGLSAERRFHERILPGVPFEPLRERFGAERLAELIEEKVRVLEGDLSDEMLGIPEEELATLEGRLDLVINCSGLVDFHAPLERAYRVNILGTRHLIELCRRTGAALVHTSTAFVAGHTRGRVPERVEPGYFPRRADSPYVAFDVEREIADLREELETLQVAARSQRSQARYTEQAIARYRELNDGFPSRAQLDNAVRRAARDHLSAEGVEAGRRRAEFWGWPNAYTYSKAIGEQLIAASEVRGAIVRPTVIESALTYPVPGWNQNATTSAPLVMLALAGFSLLPGTADHVIDMIPVDQVAWAILAVGVASMAGRNERVYQVGTSDSNPLDMRRLTDLVGIYTHSRAIDEGTDDGTVRRLWKGNDELRLVGEPEFRRRAALIESLSRRVLRESARWRDRARHRRVRELLGSVADRAESFGSEMEKAVALWDVFLPFSHDLDYRFETGNVRKLAEELGTEGEVVRFAPGEIDWRAYWLEIHIPGLRRWVLSDAPPTRALRTVSAAIPLADRLESLAARDGYRRALGYGVGDRPFALTYGELWSAAGSLAKALRERELPAGASVGVVAGMGEPWPVAVLAALREGIPVTIVPVDAWSDPAAELEAAGVSLCVRMRRRDHAELRTTRSAEPTAFEVERSTGAVANPSGISTSARTGSLAILARGESGWEIRRRLEGNALSRELAELGSTLALDDASRAVLPAPGEVEEESAPLALLTLALLYHGTRCEIVVAPEVEEVAREVAATVVVLSRECRETLEAPAELANVRTATRVVSLCPSTPREALEPLNRGGCRVVRMEWDAAGATASAHLLPAGGEEEGSTALARRGPEELVRIGAATDGRPHLFASLPVLSTRLLQNGRAGGRVLVVPDLEAVEDLQELRERILADVGSYNSAVELSGRVTAVGISLVPRGELAAGAEEEGGILWLQTRRREASGETDDPELLLRDSVFLFGSLFDAKELEFFVRHLLSEPLTRERLLIWERVLIRGARAGNLPAQVFLQSFDLEWARRRRPLNRAARRATSAVRHVRDWADAEDPEGKLLPEPVSAAVRAGIGGAIGVFFRYGLKTTVYGAAYVPPGENFLVVANHSSHLDAGLVQHAIGRWKHRLHTLAAKDYFFSTPGRRFIAHHFTRLIPTDRQRVSSDWLRRARDLLAAGECVLIFPEGTRSEGNEVRPFKASLGTLVRAAAVPVLPIYVEGSERVLPKGRAIPRGREVSVHVGPPLSAGFLAGATAGEPGLKQDRAIAALLQRAVASVPARDFWWLRGEIPSAEPLLLPPALEEMEEEVGG